MSSTHVATHAETFDRRRSDSLQIHDLHRLGPPSRQRVVQACQPSKNSKDWRLYSRDSCAFSAALLQKETFADERFATKKVRVKLG